MQMAPLFVGEWVLHKILVVHIHLQPLLTFFLQQETMMRPGAGAFPLRGHNNVQGACDMGTLPPLFPGYQHVANDDSTCKIRKSLRCDNYAEPGLDNIQMLNTIDKGNMKAMYFVGEDMAWVDANSNHVHDVLSKLDFFVVQDIFLSKTAQFADVILPGVPSLRKRRYLYQYGTSCTTFISSSS